MKQVKDYLAANGVVVRPLCSGYAIFGVLLLWLLSAQVLASSFHG